MSEIRVLDPSELTDYARLQADAYPSMGLSSAEARARYVEQTALMFREDPAREPIGLFRDGVLAGAMYLIDFRMRLFSESAGVGGIADVAVDLMHRKSHVAREMMLFAMRRFRDKGMPLAVLYPFRPDFYARMGFGYGTPMVEYRVRPEALPDSGSRGRVRLLTPDDVSAFADCYRRRQERTHGMIERSDWEARAFFTRAGTYVAGVWSGERLAGYLVFRIQPKPEVNWLSQDVLVREMWAEDGTTLRELLSFLRTLSDQVDRVVIPTFDSHLHHLFTDPRDGSDRIIPSVYHQSHTAGVGLMWRCVDNVRLLKKLKGHDFGGRTCRFKLRIHDSMLPENDADMRIEVTDGAATLVADSPCDVELALQVADWSSLILGAIDLRTLHRYGLARLSDDRYLDTLHRVFAVDAPPECVTPF